MLAWYSGEMGLVKQGRDRERVVALSAKCVSRATSAEDRHSLSAVSVEGFVKMWVRELNALRLE